MNAPRALGAALAWLLAVGAAVAVAMVAIGAVGSGILGQGPRPLGEAEVSASLAAAATGPPASGPNGQGGPGGQGNPSGTSNPSGTAEPTGGATRTPTAGSASTPPQAFASPGGTVLARCVPGVEIVAATPALGFQVDGIEDEDGARRVRFRGGDDRDTRVEVFVRCDTGTPAATVETD
ncbi:MAG TPA: hypothetical protein VGD67_18945 [Pseudonocardiaceae bacterium]